jgi:hypothetical protein
MVVPDLPMPRAPRLHRPRWLDARLLVGVLLVLGSVVVGAKVVAEADQRVRVWSVTRDLGPGAVLAESDLAVASVRLDGSARRYVAAGRTPVGATLRRPVGTGELLPLAAVAADPDGDLRRVVIEVDRFTAAGLDKGSLVDVYAVADGDADAGTDPELVLTGVTVAERVDTGAAGFGAGGGTAGVTLLVDGDDVSAVIESVASGSVYVVQVP